MKKIILPLTLLMILILSACSSTEENAKQESTSENSTEEKADNESIEVDKGLFDVEVTLPASLLEGGDINQVIEEVKADGVKEVIQNDDGSLTYKMSKSDHKKMLSEMEDKLNQKLEELKDSVDFPSIVDVKNNKSYTEFTLVVNKEKFENSLDGLVAFGLGLSGMYYQIFNGADLEKNKVTINIEDEVTGEVFNTTVYPDSLNEK